jgi:hypothetical protein
MPVVPAPLSIVSMISNDDVQMYVLSMKSCYRRIGKGQLVVIVDRDMPAESRDQLSHHFPSIEFQVLEDIDVGTCQRGGTWERLVYLLDRARHEYVIQVDCDTLTPGADLREVLECVADNRAFTLSGGEREIVSMVEAAKRARQIETSYMGIAVERKFDEYPRASALRYVRGSSGFAGFAKGRFDRSRIEEFHAHMDRLIPHRWREWGSEQCGSNFAVANSPGGTVLPFPKYANFEPALERGKSGFLHLYGTYRFDDDFFATAGQKVIAELNAR